MRSLAVDRGPRSAPPPSALDFWSNLLEAYSSSSGPIRIRPRAVFRPSSIEELQSFVSWSRREGQAIVPRGGGTGMPGGNVGPGTVVDLAHGFDWIGNVNRSHRTVEAGVGSVAAGIDRLARREGLFLPGQDPLDGTLDSCR